MQYPASWRRPPPPKPKHGDPNDPNGEELIGYVVLQVALKEWPGSDEEEEEEVVVAVEEADRRSDVNTEAAPIVYPKSTEKERRDVYCSAQLCHGKPFYLSYTGNKILVLDERRIDYSTAEEREEVKRLESSLSSPPLQHEMEGEERDGEDARKSGGEEAVDSSSSSFRDEERSDEATTAGDAVVQEEEDSETRYETSSSSLGPGTRIGTILLQVAVHIETVEEEEEEEEEEEVREVPPTPKVLKSTETERREVFCSRKAKLNEKPFYYTHTGNRVFVLDPKRIHYLPGKDPASKREAARRHAEEEQRRREDEERRLREEAARAELPPVMHGSDVRVGTICVQKRDPEKKDLSRRYPLPSCLGPSEHMKKHTVIRDVFCASNEFPLKKPYYLTDTLNKIYVVDASKITLDHPPPPKKKQRTYF